MTEALGNVRIWLHGLVAAAISAGSTAAGAAVALPEFFNFTHDGLVHTAKLVVIPAAVAVFAYLKQSPLPSMSITKTTTQSTTVDITKE